MNKCLDCKKEVSTKNTKRCKSCSNKLITKNRRDYNGINNPNFDNHKLAGENHFFFGKKRPNITGKNHPLFGTHISIEQKNKLRIYRTGKIMLEETKKKISNSLKGNKCYRFGLPASHGKIFKYNNFSFRSSWEYKFAKFLDKNNIKWLYEPESFNLVNCTYRPDFYLPESDMYIEIKGWWRDDAKLKFDLFKIFYPNKKIQILLKQDLIELQIIKRRE